MSFNKKFFTTGGIVASTPSAAGGGFNTVTYQGNNSTNARTDVGFKPDLIWFKNRSGAYLHQIYDSIRGVDKCLNTGVGGIGSRTGTEPEFNDGGNDLMSFDDNGFTIGASALGSVNENGFQHVAWCWKAAGAANTYNVLEGGTVTSDSTASGAGITAGSITTGWEVSANRDAGFSIVKYTGNFTASTVGHGLSAAPEMVIVKNTDSPTNWWVWHTSLGDGTKYLKLNGADAVNTASSIWNGTVPTSTVFSVANDGGSNGSGNDIIAYCFHSVDGYQKVGSYTGTSSSVTVSNLGFQPRFLLIKGATAGASFGGGWHIVDSVRGDGGLGVAKFLRPHASDAEFTNAVYGVTFTSDGFIIPSGSSVNLNTNNGTFIYLAIA